MKRINTIILFLLITSFLLTIASQVQADSRISDDSELSDFSVRDLGVLDFAYALAGDESTIWPDVPDSDKLAVTINGTLCKTALVTGTISGQVTVEGKDFILNTTSLEISKVGNELILSCSD